jgi:hypothetical protein
MMVEPIAATDVFAMDTRGGTNGSAKPSYISNFPVDMAIHRQTTGNPASVSSRLNSGEYLLTDSTDAESGDSSQAFDYNNGWEDTTSVTSNRYSWMWKRAKGFMDVVAFNGTGVAGRTVSHNLGAVPEMMWVKKRSAAANWQVYHSGTGNTKTLYLNSNASYGSASISRWNNTTPTSSVFSLGDDSDINGSGSNMIAYLFATLDGISKVGSYTGNGATSQNIDCGFSNGARFVMIKCTSHSGSWHLMDTLRGIVSGSESHLALDTRTAAESDDFVDPYSAGFAAVSTAGENNAFNRTYIFYAIA